MRDHDMQEEAAPVGVTVYSKPDCQQCTATYRTLDKLGVEYTVVDISQNEIARDFAASLGHLQAPVVVTTDGHHWSGFRPDQIRALGQRLAAPDGSGGPQVSAQQAQVTALQERLGAIPHQRTRSPAEVRSHLEARLGVTARPPVTSLVQRAEALRNGPPAHGPRDDPPIRSVTPERQLHA